MAGCLQCGEIRTDIVELLSDGRLDCRGCGYVSPAETPPRLIDPPPAVERTRRDLDL